MYIDKMIASEETSSMFERWELYRKELTDYVVCNIASNTVSTVEKPTLAIWGAGGCNDIDLRRLAKYAKLVLIDCEKTRCQKAIEAYGLDESQATAVDLFFYDVPYAQYEHFEWMLYDKTPVEQLHEFLSELLLEAVSTDMHLLPEFDYSIAVGIASQLNARLTALVYLYKDNYEKSDIESLIDHIQIMDKAAVRRLNEMIKATTHRLTIYGYEDRIIETDTKLNIYANEQLKEHIFDRDDVRKNNTEEMQLTNLTWPFVEGKTYDMVLVNCEN